MTSGRDPGPGATGPSLLPVLSHRPPVPQGGDGLAEGGVCGPGNTILTKTPGRPGGYPDIQPNNKDPSRLKQDRIFAKLTETPLQKLTPGYAEPHPACQDVRFQVVCPEDLAHHRRLARYNCHRPACPKCWPGWAARAADDAAARVEGYRDATGKALAPRHITFSPEPGTVSTLEDLYDQGNRALRLAGVEAAMVIPHPYRLKREARTACEEIPARSWGNRYTEALAKPTWRDRVNFSPHLHAIVYGPLPDPETFKKRTGWLYVNHDEDRPGRAGLELRGTIYYLLSHAWVQGNNAVVRYWFGMNNHSLRKIPGETYKVHEPCPVCQAPCRVIPPDIQSETGPPRSFYQDVHNAPVHLVKVKTWEYILAGNLPDPRRVEKITACHQAMLCQEP